MEVFMLGFDIEIYELTDGMDITSNKIDKPILARWSSGGFSGLDWIDNLVSEAKAEDLGGNGYPLYYKAQAQVVLQTLATTTPKNKEQTIMDDENAMSSDWRFEIDTSQIAKCDPDQQLIVEAWDLS
jgi:hypothetical protein